MKHTIGTQWLANPNRGRNHFLIVFGARMHILYIFKAEILMLTNWSYKSLPCPPPIMLIVEHGTVISFKHIPRDAPFWCLFLEPHLTS